MTRRLALLWKSVAVLGAVLLVIALGYAGFLYHINNYHTVVADEVYRSAQFTGNDLAAYSKRDSIRTVINLRGASPKAAWYKDEVAAAARLGIRHIDFKMGSGEKLEIAEAQQLVELMQHAQKPVLIHCHSGANRTGLAAALYLIVVKGKTLAQAQEQLSLKYGHFSLSLSPAFAMDDTLMRYAHAHETGSLPSVKAVAYAR